MRKAFDWDNVSSSYHITQRLQMVLLVSSDDKKMPPVILDKVFSLFHLEILSRDRVTIDGIWLGNWIY
jgi:hypothetical protein